jgi:hypothetical protein
MRLIRLFLMAITLVAILSGIAQSPSYASPWSTHAKVVVPMQAPDTNNKSDYVCWGASLGRDRLFYEESTINTGGGNVCQFIFDKVNVRTDGYYQFTYTYTFENERRTTTTMLYITKPDFNTYTTFPVTMPSE